jgi:hypothetical protein
LFRRGKRGKPFYQNYCYSKDELQQKLVKYILLAIMEFVHISTFEKNDLKKC